MLFTGVRLLFQLSHIKKIVKFPVFGLKKNKKDAIVPYCPGFVILKICSPVSTQSFIIHER